MSNVTPSCDPDHAIHSIVVDLCGLHALDIFVNKKIDQEMWSLVVTPAQSRNRV
jgi:hypothetical protein